MTFAHLDSLQKIICEELDLIRRIYAGLSESRVHSTSPGPRDEDIHVETLLDPPSIFAPYHSLGIDSDNESDSATAPAPHNVSGLAYASPPPSPSVVRFPATPSSLTSSSTPCSHKNSPSSSTQQSQQSSSFSLSLDWPNLDEVYDPSSAAEALTQHPDVIQASQKVIAACHHVAAILQAPFLTICDASMGYHLPSCLRLVEASHTIEILRDAGPSGMPVSQIAERNGVSKSKLAHVLRLLSTHHLLREVSPDTFALNRLSSLIDTGKSIEDLKASDAKGCPEEKYHDTNGVSAFVGMCTDEVAKASAYLTEAWYLSPEIYVTHGRDPTRAPFNFAFGLCGKGDEGLRLGVNSNKFRLERFGKAMTGSSSWEHKGAILEAFDWQALPRGSLIVDVGGGIGSLTEQLATAFGEGREMTDLGFKFVVQDREGVVNMAKEMWAKSRPDLLHRVPLRKVAVFILRVVLHDWPDSLAQKILLRLREVATSDTKLILGDFMLSFACADVGDDDTQGFQRATPQAPLLANLGKASANAYWMDLTMQVVFNSLERTRQEIYDLCLSAGWKVTKVSRSPGSAFCYIVAVP
ncbi:S-adenosyl-L-methionine-dependent methyltransferase, partial [Fistulina hepatica ATCC 64428]